MLSHALRHCEPRFPACRCMGFAVAGKLRGVANMFMSGLWVACGSE
jgi:hypothetical protein